MNIIAAHLHGVCAAMIIPTNKKVDTLMVKLYFITLVYLYVLIPKITFAKEVAVMGRVFDNLTNEALVGAKVDLINPLDSTYIVSCVASKLSINDRDTIYSSEFGLIIPDNANDYILRISDYEHSDYYIDLSKSKLKSPLINLGNIYLKKIVKNLSEVTVTVSKVKFYNNGDTIVYNADAFILAEGSMLDALIRQLPGAELHSDGRIYLNGKFVDNLILNGKDFFKGNNTIMLENIGAYTVKNIKVYERLNAIDSYIGQVLTGNKELVMDVKLKKDYMDSLLGYISVGAGTSDRYISQGYISRLTPRSRVSLFANINNVNESRKPGEGVMDWIPSEIGTGLRKTLSGGIDYYYDLPDNIWKIKGDFTVNHINNTDRTSVAHTNFTHPSFSYAYFHNTIMQKNFEIATNHNIKMERSNWMWWLRPLFKYKKWNANLNNTEASFDSEQQDWSSEFIRSVYENDLHNSSELVNRKLTEECIAGHNTNFDLSTGVVYKIPGSLDVVLFEGTFVRIQNHEIKNEDYILNFIHTPEMDEFSRRKFNNFPYRNTTISTKASYLHVFSKSLSLSCDYHFSQNRKRETSLLYSITKQWNDKTLLPSFWEGGVFLPDYNNSYALSSKTNTHTFSPALSATIGNCWIQFSFPLIISDDNLKYHRGEIEANKHRTTLLFEQKRNSFIRYEYLDSKWFATVTYTTKAPDLLSMIDFTDTTDPLIITTGNPNLKNSETLHANASYSLSKPRKRLYFSVGIDYQATSNALAKGYSYNPETGVKIYKTYNVNGNWFISGNNYVSWEFGELKMFSIKNIFSVKFNQSVDLLSFYDKSYLNKVHCKTINENLSFGINKHGQRLAIVGNIDYSKYSGNGKYFNNFNAIEFHYGIQGVFKFPLGLGLNTDFMVYSRRGFQDNALNTNNYIWNARATYSILKGNVIFTLDGYDILHNLKNIFYSVNAQGRTETIRTVLPRYFMFGIQWKFNSKE